MDKRLAIWFFLIFVGLLVIPSAFVKGQSSQNLELLYNEAQVVYLGNLTRRQHGLSPMRWNSQLTQASRWFTWDSVENRATPYCGHQDTQGHWPDWRAIAYGYKGIAGAENAFCGNVKPEDAIRGWMDSPGHRANLLDPNSREIGVGYYVRERDGRGYIAQMFGHDPIHPPVVIENEALSTPSNKVNLYIYDVEENGNIRGMGKAIEMMISNDPTFRGASWEPYATEKVWTLESGQGWRTVYVKLRDRLQRTVTIYDNIYVGDEFPLNQLGDSLMSTTYDTVTLSGLSGNGLPMVQFSPGWIADDSFEEFKHWWGEGKQVNDSDALGGTAFQLSPGDQETFVWLATTNFIKDTPLVAYFRLKVPDTSSDNEVARISVEASGQEYGPVRLTGGDFVEANNYKEFAVSFTFNQNEREPFLKFNVWRSGSTTVLMDAVTIFTAPQAVQETMMWQLPDGNYRGQGVWIRNTDETQRFTPLREAVVEILNPIIPTPQTPTLPASNTPTLPASNTPTLPASNTPTLPASNIPTLPASNTPTLPASNTPTLPASNTPTASNTTEEATPTREIHIGPTATPAQDQRCFQETGYCIIRRIREYWEQNGGLPVFGYPIGPQHETYIEGKAFQVQWFERNRMELHPENQPPYDVLLGRLGADRLEGLGHQWQNFARSEPQDGCRYFEQTGQNICGNILVLWRANGLEFDGLRGKSEAENLALFGMPISGQRREVLHDGQEYVVQWFERARFELHPENHPPYHVLLGLLGNEIQGIK